MKILLAACNAKYIHSNLAVYNLKSCSGEYSSRVVVKEYTINQIRDDILKDIYLEQPDVVCFSCYIWNISFVRELVPDLKKILPQVEFWAGGPEVSYDAVEFLKKNPAFFGVMVGEGEETFHELAGYYIERKPETLSGIRGVAFRDENKGRDIVHTGWRELMDLSKVPFAYSNLTEFKNRIIYYERSRGCPFSCSYCLSSIDKKLRFRDIELVKKELQFFIDNKVPQVKFVDRTFNCKHDHAMEIWRYITENDNGITNFHFEISADLLRAEELALMKTMRPGLIQLEIGVQSTNPQTIKAIRRTMDFEKLKGIVEQIHSFGNIHQHLDLIAGLPYEGYDSFHKSFCDVYALRPEQFQLGFLAEALSEAVAAIGNGTAARTPQDESRQTYASMLTKEMSPIDWTRSAREIDCQVRGLIPWPCAACDLAGQRFKVYRTAPGEQTGAAPGTVLSAGKQGIQVACGRGESLYLTEIQAEGGKRMAAASYLLGHPLEV